MKTDTILTPGSTLGVCAPCARFDKLKLVKGISTLETMGFKIIVPDDIYHTKRYLAGSDKHRANQLNRFYENDNVQGIIAARGGYGSIRILRYLDWDLIRNHPKIFIGFSDSTILHSVIHERTGQYTIHGPNVVSLADPGQKTIGSLLKTLTKPVSDQKISFQKIIIPGKCRGILKGGNLATLTSLVGTPYMPNFTKSILFVEDVREPAYKIDRMLFQMELAGTFKGLAGVVTGSFEKCDNDHYIDEILLDIFRKYNIPVIGGVNSGHGQVNLSIPLGVSVSIDTKKNQFSFYG